jgi:hypothetical protein
MGHHNGSVWPHDHALILSAHFRATGSSRYGFLEEAAPVFSESSTRLFTSIRTGPQANGALGHSKNICDAKRWSGFGPVNRAENREIGGPAGNLWEDLSDRKLN